MPTTVKSILGTAKIPLEERAEVTDRIMKTLDAGHKQREFPSGAKAF